MLACVNGKTSEMLGALRQPPGDEGGSPRGFGEGGGGGTLALRRRRSHDLMSLGAVSVVHGLLLMHIASFRMYI